jgi:hypothetical protein
VSWESVSASDLDCCPVCRTCYFDLDFVLEGEFYFITCHHCYTLRKVPQKIVAQHLLDRDDS